MPTPPAERLSLIVAFQPLFTKPVWAYAQVLLLGALLARGPRTVTACLRVVGLSEEKAFQNYHRVLIGHVGAPGRRAGFCSVCCCSCCRPMASS